MRVIPSAVLFACSENSIRSPMAEGFLKFLHGHRVYVDSVGVRKREINGFVVTVMEEIGVDMSLHKSKTFSDLEDLSYDLVIALSPEAQHQAMELTRVMACEVEFWPTFDPSIVEGRREARLQAYRQVRDDLMGRIKERFPVDTLRDV
jgi:protein-tyrosine-phosphatase